MIKKHLYLAAALLLIDGSAYAQQPPPAPVSPAVQDIATDWNMMQGSLSHLGKSIQALSSELAQSQAEVSRLKAELEKEKTAHAKQPEKPK